MKTARKINYINHVAIVADASSSMARHAHQVVQVVDGQNKYLASRSTDMNQETRATVYAFNYTTECLYYDMDVLRLPSIKGEYHPTGMTALVDATLQAIDDLEKTAQLYGDHAFLLFIITDGIENNSKRHRDVLIERIKNLPENWTVAFLVPDQRGVFDTKSLGIPAGNIAIWDINADFSEVGHTVRQATDTFMTGRASGIRGTRSLFSTAPEAVNKQTISAAGLTPVPVDKYMITHVLEKCEARTWVQEQCGRPFVLGNVFYPLTKSEKIQPQKKLAVMDKKTKRVYQGDGIRDLLGLPLMEVRVKPDHNPDYLIYVQSTAPNRHVHPGWDLLLML